MRLINVHTLKFEDFVNSLDLPPYAVLSHTWGNEEVSFAEFEDPTESCRQRAGFRKIRLTCQHAREHDLNWAWLDTCCIDKSSSAELSEAINTMFKWYSRAEICFAYLDDWPDSDGVVSSPRGSVDQAKIGNLLRECRWFSRGWTLQELIAPRKVEFYIDTPIPSGWSNKIADRSDRSRKKNLQWVRIGSKEDLITALQTVTRIDERVIRGAPLSSISVAKRMSWAAGRKTSREEDIAYCLLGIFDVNMPLLYGEGTKAFQRLQEAIMSSSEDHTLFAWRATPESAGQFPYRGLFADSPDEFIGCEGLVPFQSRTSPGQTPMAVTNRGIPLTLTISQRTTKPSQSPAIFRTGKNYEVCLNCQWDADSAEVCGIELKPLSLGGDQYVRCRPSETLRLSPAGQQHTLYIARTLHMPSLSYPPEDDFRDGIFIDLAETNSRLIKIDPRDLEPYKVGLELKDIRSEKRILVLIWVKNALSQDLQTYYTIDGFVVRPEKVAAEFKTATKPSKMTQKHQQDNSKYIFINSGTTIQISGTKGKVLGFDMLSVAFTFPHHSRFKQLKTRLRRPFS